MKPANPFEIWVKLVISSLGRPSEWQIKDATLSLMMMGNVFQRVYNIAFKGVGNMVDSIY